MSRVIYNSPIGDGKDNPSKLFIKSVFGLGEAYWQDLRGCGAGVFTFIDEETPCCTLEVRFKDGVGFCLEYLDRSPEGHQSYITLAARCAENTAVKLHYAGEPFFVPAPLFIPAQRAIECAMEFCLNGRSFDGIHWYPRNRLNWDPWTGEWHPPFEACLEAMDKGMTASWLSTEVICLARGIHKARAFDRMPILADALEEAGCTDDAVLSHCRASVEHVQCCRTLGSIVGDSD